MGGAHRVRDARPAMSRRACLPGDYEGGFLPGGGGRCSCGQQPPQGERVQLRCPLHEEFNPRLVPPTNSPRRPASLGPPARRIRRPGRSLLLGAASSRGAAVDEATGSYRGAGGNTDFQSSFTLTTVQPRALASSRPLSSFPTCDSRS